MKQFLPTLLSLFFATALFAQKTGSVSGTLSEPGTGKPIAAATIQVITPNNGVDSLVKGSFSENDGSFILVNVPRVESLYLIVSAVGFTPFETILNWKTSDKTGRIYLGKIEMAVNTNALDNVVVTGRKKAFEMKLDRRVFNPDQQITAKGGTAVDVLKNIPSVSVDAQGAVELRGSSPQIFVDGRPTILTLEQIAADDIERVEVITNPSSKFDASTTGGIINVVLKKNRARGLNGNASAGLGFPDILNGYIGLNLRQNKVNFFATGNYNQSGGRAKGETERTNLENGLPAGGFRQVSFNDRLRRSYNGRVGLDYFIDKYNVLSVSQGFNGSTGRSDGEQDQEYFDSKGDLSETGFREEFYNWNSTNANTQVFYKRTFAKKGRELTADFTYNTGSGTNSSFFTNEIKPVGAAAGDVTRVRNAGGSETDQITAQIDYINPYGDNGKLEAGLRTYINDYSSFFDAFSVANSGESKLPLSNNIRYRETVNAGYINYGNKIEKLGLSYMAGVRLEFSDFAGTLVDSAKSFGYKWPEDLSDIMRSVFPSLYLTKDLGEDAQLQLNYSRRIRRPNFWQLNPFVDISDPLNIRQGNINLIPESVNVFELNYNRDYNKGNYLISAYFRNNVDDITRYSDTISQEQLDELGNAAVNPNAILNTFINANYTNTLGLEMTVQHKFNENFDIMPTVNLQYRKVKANVGELVLDNEGFSWEAQLTANYRVQSNKKWLDKMGIQLTSEYESREVIPQGMRIPEFRVDAAIRKDFMTGNKASLVFAVDDMFNSRRWGSEIETDRFIQSSYSRWNVRSFRLTFSYRFGNNDFQLLQKRKGGPERDNDGGEGGG